ncbi:hypothetical protein AN639_10825 [Candidatus Epulonipiscium fishelsonii]|uniref:Uncharacterized protein n=1 Tax=Candidatus Epulonipiscium fishelsonii TaxID=77094 RepID=A0ACC8XED6_9FIRM|nr:hypothetical protein AN396_03625 [Epulopiscium sp. SCG-B11WGA-EpuloA1]ONI43225.1 hypothetical protein AN639_10825 [Epulopiscium sp. SCG-B05WGA-EpuloA1]
MNNNLFLLTNEIGAYIQNKDLIKITETNCYKYLKEKLNKLPNEFHKLPNIDFIELNLIIVYIQIKDKFSYPYISIQFEIGNNLLYYEARYNLQENLISQKIILPEDFIKMH